MPQNGHDQESVIYEQDGLLLQHSPSYLDENGVEGSFLFAETREEHGQAELMDPNHIHTQLGHPLENSNMESSVFDLDREFAWEASSCPKGNFL